MSFARNIAHVFNVSRWILSNPCNLAAIIWAIVDIYIPLYCNQEDTACGVTDRRSFATNRSHAERKIANRTIDSQLFGLIDFKYCAYRCAQTRLHHWQMPQPTNVNRLHIIGGKNHGKTTLIVDLVQELARRGVTVGTIKHTHHHHELDVPGKDSHRHRLAGAGVVGILSPSMNAIFFPVDEPRRPGEDRYSMFAASFAQCRVVLVEGDSQTTAPKIEVWRSKLGAPPLASRDPSILAIVTDDVPQSTTQVLSRSDVRNLATWILESSPAGLGTG